MMGLGSVRFISDENGTFTDSYDYQAFGKLLHAEGNTTNSYLYAGKQRDKRVETMEGRLLLLLAQILF